MDIKLQTLIFVILIFCFTFSKDAFGWEGRLFDGTVITRELLNIIIKKHEQWITSKKKSGTQAIFDGSSLESIDLSNQNLQAASFRGANLKNANLKKTNFHYAYLHNADLSGADLTDSVFIFAVLSRANLTGSDLTDVDLRGADLRRANMTQTNMYGCNLTAAIFNRTKLKGANLHESQLTRTVFDVLPNDLPNTDQIAYAYDLHKVEFLEIPSGLFKLREEFIKSGYRIPERDITYAIKRQERRMYYGFFENIFTYILFEITCAWGRLPFRPIKILIIFIPFFTILYLPFLRKKGPDGIWKYWPPDRMRSDLGSNEHKAPIYCKDWSYCIYTAFYFSMLSAFRGKWGTSISK